MAIYKTSPVAEQDLVDIYVRGSHKWGEKQAVDYQRQLIATFHFLAENPELGRSVAIRPQLQRHDLDPYVIFYRKFSYGVQIARILYKNRSMERHL
ncbi:MAG: type II toxin-antitoxin system RelE/ParE family toxin [gamma proteobacterium symbiont of Bathyaustriella thionipta]|nr:type II toxin-antitoxin system RelE/ParE family toxin [gamma proteobacterium symbiont of Bathyaustriella thionipta]MCU7949424.1 type II toxin-antitoxin system RelE/ParE family toxin [gamma proteobacterium symbiont of Bathyaustriella thionipta]MCU7953082.1 type II toxin-antitoxin system RelE/ParE family toxin [gamma proteobacterium symbiont of Bathyaustriella thionipta]MCU7956011.1 type II toxin-antitoxin system RelE/ParE family toxin [gamma proteobacterium symbiont of Bathyaustriella thionipt